MFALIRYLESFPVRISICETLPMRDVLFLCVVPLLMSWLSNGVFLTQELALLFGELLIRAGQGLSV
jgi:hypothetical protein